jgi:uncharacterized membrane protein
MSLWKGDKKMEIKRSVRIEAPVEKVFQYASDYRKWPAFYEGISDVKAINDTTRGDGARFIYKAKVMGMKVTVGTEFQQFKQNEGWTGISFKGVNHRTQWLFEAAGNSTQFTHAVSSNLPWYMGGRFLEEKVLAPEWEKIVENSLQNLKERMEEGVI